MVLFLLPREGKEGRKEGKMKGQDGTVSLTKRREGRKEGR